MTRLGRGEQGLYLDDTRYLSRLELRLGDRRPLPRGTLQIHRAQLVWQSACYERIRLSNPGPDPVRLSLALFFDADYADIFEVRGLRRERRGTLLEPRLEQRGRAGLPRARRSGAPDTPRLRSRPARPVGLARALRRACRSAGHGGARRVRRLRARRRARDAAAVRHGACGVGGAARGPAAGALPRRHLQRGLQHLAAALGRGPAHADHATPRTGPTRTPACRGSARLFGRDGIITALETLWLDPRSGARRAAPSSPRPRPPRSIRRATPSRARSCTRCARGEMAALGEVPFGRYYGSVDATPLFVMLAGAYFERTGDLGFVESHLAARRARARLDRPLRRPRRRRLRRVRAALRRTAWCSRAGRTRTTRSSTPTAALAEGPIALCEVQGYVYAARARRRRARRARSATTTARTRSRAQAEQLRAALRSAFWCDELGTYALALDGAQAPVPVRTSNAGHCSVRRHRDRRTTRARRWRRRCWHRRSFSGWGVRTLAAAERALQPDVATTTARSGRTTTR